MICLFFFVTLNYFSNNGYFYLKMTIVLTFAFVFQKLKHLFFKNIVSLNLRMACDISNESAENLNLNLSETNRYAIHMKKISYGVVFVKVDLNHLHFQRTGER